MRGPSCDTVVGLNDDPVTVEARMLSVLVGTRLYELIVVSNSEEPEAFHRFVDSFKPQL